MIIFICVALLSTFTFLPLFAVCHLHLRCWQEQQPLLPSLYAILFLKFIIAAIYLWNSVATMATHPQRGGRRQTISTKLRPNVPSKLYNEWKRRRNDQFSFINVWILSIFLSSSNYYFSWINTLHDL